MRIYFTYLLPGVGIEENGKKHCIQSIITGISLEYLLHILFKKVYPLGQNCQSLLAMVGLWKTTIREFFLFSGKPDNNL